MKYLWSLLLCAIVGCGTPVDPASTETPGPAVCEDGPATPVTEVERRAAVLGSAANGIRRADDALWIVESGSNTVTRFDLETETAETFVDVGNERNPWDLWVGPERIWITNFLADTVTIADRGTGEVLWEIDDSLDGPAGITGTERYVYVGNVHFRGDNEYGTGSVTILDRATGEVLGSRRTARKNPQVLTTVETSVGERVVVVDSGAIRFDEEGAHAGTEAAVELWAETDDPTNPDVTAAILPLVEDSRIGIPGSPAHQKGSDVIYFASGTGPVVFALDARKGTWLRGASQPIELPGGGGDSLNHAAIDDRGVLYVTSFNHDALYLLDTRCDAMLGDPIELEASEMLGGPHGVVPVRGDDGVDAWYAMSLANELGRVRLQFTE